MTTSSLLILISVLYLIYLINRILNFLTTTIDKNLIYFNQREINEIFEKSKRLAYTKVYNENIVTYTWNETRVNKKDMDIFSKKFIELVFLYSGKDIINDLIKLHGDMDSLVSSLTSEFIMKVIDDEIELFSKKTEEFKNGTALENLMVNKTGVEHV